MGSEHDRTIADLTEAIRLNPRNASAYARRGAAYRMKGDYDRAIADCTEAIRLNPNEYSAFADRGVAYRIKGDLLRAIADCTEAKRLRSLPGWVKNKDWELEKDWVEWDDDNKNRIWPLTLKEVITLIRDKKISATTTVWKEGMGEQWAKAGAMPELRAAIDAKSEHDWAIIDLTEVVRLNPKDARAFAKRGDMYRIKNDHDRAIADLTEAIRLNPTFSWAFAVRGETYRAKNWLENANAAIRRLGTGESESSFLKTDDYDRAIADITEAIRLDRANAAWQRYLSKAYADRGKTNRRMLNYDRAIADCTEAIRLDPTNAEAFAVRGDVRWAKDEYGLATTDATEAIRLDPKQEFKELLDKVRRSIRNAGAKDAPVSRPEQTAAHKVPVKASTQSTTESPTSSWTPGLYYLSNGSWHLLESDEQLVSLAQSKTITHSTLVVVVPSDNKTPTPVSSLPALKEVVDQYTRKQRKGWFTNWLAGFAYYNCPNCKQNSAMPVDSEILERRQEWRSVWEDGRSVQRVFNLTLANVYYKCNDCGHSWVTTEVVADKA